MSLDQSVHNKLRLAKIQHRMVTQKSLWSKLYILLSPKV